MQPTKHADYSGGFVTDAFDFVMTEHAAWLPTGAGTQRVIIVPDGGRWLVGVERNTYALTALADGAVPVHDVFTLPNDVAPEIPDLATALRRLGLVVRFRNADLWDAIGTAIIRQVIRAGQSKRLYWAFCKAYGERVGLPGGGTCALFPTPETVLRLSDDQFSSIGMAFKRRPLQAAAEAYLEQGAKWRELTPDVLATELQTVPRIGPWTANAAVADWSNDWSLYPYADLAVRTWAKRAAPGYDWPDDEPTFGRTWRSLAGEHLCSLTLLTLAWGSQHGDIG
jgi:DNA-3-methyladenine glycosylase II